MKTTNYSRYISYQSFKKFPSKILSYSYTIENTIYSLLKLYTPLKEICDEKFFGSKRNYPHYLFYIKIYALDFSAYNNNDLNLNEEACKIFPQTNFDINFFGQIISIKSNGFLQFVNNKKGNNEAFLFNIDKNKYYKLTIERKAYLFVIVYDNKIEIDGILKSVDKFDIVDAFKSQVLYIKDKINTYNFLSNNNINNNFKYVINKGTKLLIDIKSKYSITDLKSQSKFHDKILSNLYKSCNENINNYYYIFIITDEDKTQKKAQELRQFLDEVNFNLNIIIFETANSTICGHNYDVVLDKGTLTKDIYKKVDNIENEIKEMREDLSELKKKIIPEIHNDLSELKNKIIPEIHNDISELKNKIIPEIRKDILTDIKQTIVPQMTKDIIDSINNNMIHLKEMQNQENNNIDQEINNNSNSEGPMMKIKRP